MQRRKLTALLLLTAALSPAAAPLPDAAEHRDWALVRKLLATGTDANTPQVDGTTALHWAAYHDNTEAIMMMGESAEAQPLALIRGAPIEFVNVNDSTELRMPLREDLYSPFFR